MSWKDYDTDEIITDEEMEDICTKHLCFFREPTISVKCDGTKESCPYYKYVE